MVGVLQSPIVVVLVAMLAYAGSTFFFWRTPNLPVPQLTADGHAPAPKPVYVEHGPSWDFSNPEVDQLVRELRQERAAIAAKSKQLDELAARLKSEQVELHSATQAVHQLQRDFDQNIVRLKDDETTNLRRLAKVYSTMEPDGALRVLRELDDSTLVKVLSFMKDEQIATVLSALARAGDSDAKKVGAISERLRLLQARTNSPKGKP